MAIEGITFSDSDKEIKVIIDGKEEVINVQTINRLESHITINELNNTAFKDDIIVDATLSPVKQGIITVSLWDINKEKQYYTANISSTDGNFVHNIPNNVKAGQYIVTLEYNGNKYYNSTSIDKQIEIKRREIFCDLDSTMFYVQPGNIFSKTFKLVDKINNQYIRNCEISYVYKDEIFNIISDNNGNIKIEVPIPDTGDNHCTENNITYPVTFYLDNSKSYLLKNTTIKLLVGKLNTELFVSQVKDNYGYYIKGYVLSEDGYANYGDVEVSILDSYKKTATVDSEGYFETDVITISDILNQLSSENENSIFKASVEIPTEIILEADIDTIKVGETINVTATVKDNKNNIVVDGVVDFKMYNSKGNVVYRYASELDEKGHASFVFYTSKTGTYSINAIYKSIITYKSSKTKEDIAITVGE